MCLLYIFVFDNGLKSQNNKDPALLLVTADSHCSSVAMLGFAAEFTLRGVFDRPFVEKEILWTNHCLIPLLAISRKLLSIQIKASNLLLQRLPGEAVVHLKSSK